MLTAAATPNPTGRETRSPTSLLDLPHLDTAGGPKVRRGDPRARGGAGPKTPCTREGSCNPKRLTQYHSDTQNCDQRGQPMRWGRPRDLAQVRICKKTTMTTAKAAKKREEENKKRLTPLYRLRTVIFRAVQPSRRVNEPQPPASWPRGSPADRRRSQRSPDRRRLAPEMGPAIQRGLRKLIT